MLRTLAVMGRPKKPEQTKPIRLPESVVKRIARIAAHKGQDPGDYVAERFAPLLKEDEDEMIEDVQKEHSDDEQAKPKKPRK